MDYAEQLLKFYAEASKSPSEPKRVEPPASARLTYTYYDPCKPNGCATMLVKTTKARWYVWLDQEWTIKTEAETRALIAWAEEDKEHKLAKLARMWKADEFVGRCRAIRFRNQAMNERDALLASIEEAAFRMTIKAKTVEERIRINDEKESLEEQVRDAFDCGDYDEFSKYQDIYEAIDFPELPEAWVIIAANPDHRQYNFRI